MLAPHELKNKEFSKSLRGYSTVEVDEHIDFLIEKYTELYRENDELEKKLRLTEAQLDAMKAEEESIRATLINAQKASTRIINEANERADVIMRSAKTSCDRLIAELKANVNKENDRLREIQREVAAFKAALFEGYQSHIELIEKIAPEVKIEEYDGKQAEELSRLVIDRIRQDLSGKKGIISGSEEPYAVEAGEEEETEEISASDISVPAELSIPDELFSGSEKEEDDASASVRDGEEYAADEEELITERSTLSDNSGSGIIDSIKKINSGVREDEDDDEEFLRMLKNVSADSEKDMSATDEFNMVYDGKTNQ